MARLAEAQLVADGTYPNAAVFADAEVTSQESSADAPLAMKDSGDRRIDDFYPLERRDPRGRWTAGGGAEGSADPNVVPVNAEKRRREYERELEATGRPPPDVEAEPLPDLEPQLGPATHVPGAPLGAGAPARPVTPTARSGGSGLAAPDTPDRELPRVDPRAAQKLDNALSDYDTRRYMIDDQAFQLDRSGMRHILERHAPEYWDGSEGETQTFFPRGTNVEQIQQAVGDVLGQNRDAIIAEPSRYGWNLFGTSGGVRYNVTTYRGRVTRLVPLP